MSFETFEDEEPPEDCPAFMTDECPVLLGEQEEPCEGCRWLKLNPNYREKEQVHIMGDNVHQSNPEQGKE